MEVIFCFSDVLIVSNLGWHFAGQSHFRGVARSTQQATPPHQTETDDEGVTHWRVSAALLFSSSSLKLSLFLSRGGYSALSVACREKLLVSQALHLNLNKRPLKSPSRSHVTEPFIHSERTLNSEQSVWLEHIWSLEVKMTPKLTAAAFWIHSRGLECNTLCQFHPKIEQPSF